MKLRKNLKYIKTFVHQKQPPPFLYSAYSSTILPKTQYDYLDQMEYRLETTNKIRIRKTSTSQAGIVKFRRRRKSILSTSFMRAITKFHPITGPFNRSTGNVGFLWYYRYKQPTSVSPQKRVRLIGSREWVFIRSFLRKRYYIEYLTDYVRDFRTPNVSVPLITQHLFPKFNYFI